MKNMKTRGRRETAIAPKTILVLKREPKLLGLVFGQEPNQRARQHQAEHQEAHNEERRKGVEDDDLVPGAEREGRGDGAESDDPGHKKGQEDSAQRQP